MGQSHSAFDDGRRGSLALARGALSFGRSAPIFVIALGFAFLFLVNWSRYDMECADISGSDSRGTCHMLEGFYAAAGREFDDAIASIMAARDDAPENALYALYQCQWQSELGLHVAAARACEDALVLGAPGDAISIAAATLSTKLWDHVSDVEALERVCEEAREKSSTSPETDALCRS